jgi:hypothetical protein
MPGDRWSGQPDRPKSANRQAAQTVSPAPA